jgi:hypothetical protein
MLCEGLAALIGHMSGEGNAIVFALIQRQSVLTAL